MSLNFFFPNSFGNMQHSARQIFEQKQSHHLFWPRCPGRREVLRDHCLSCQASRLSRAFLPHAPNCILFLSLCRFHRLLSDFLVYHPALGKNSTKGTNMQCGPMCRYQNRKNRGRNQRIYRVFKQVRCRCHSWHEYSIVIVAQNHCSKPFVRIR